MGRQHTLSTNRRTCVGVRAHPWNLGTCPRHWAKAWVQTGQSTSLPWIILSLEVGHSISALSQDCRRPLWLRDSGASQLSSASVAKGISHNLGHHCYHQASDENWGQETSRDLSPRRMDLDFSMQQLAGQCGHIISWETVPVVERLGHSPA